MLSPARPAVGVEDSQLAESRRLESDLVEANAHVPAQRSRTPSAKVKENESQMGAAAASKRASKSKQAKSAIASSSSEPLEPLKETQEESIPAEPVQSGESAPALPSRLLRCCGGSHAPMHDGEN